MEPVVSGRLRTQKNTIKWAAVDREGKVLGRVIATWRHAYCNSQEPLENHPTGQTDSKTSILITQHQRLSAL